MHAQYKRSILAMQMHIGQHQVHNFRRIKYDIAGPRDGGSAVTRNENNPEIPDQGANNNNQQTVVLLTSLCFSPLFMSEQYIV